jgi:hypothetical protein
LRNRHGFVLRGGVLEPGARVAPEFTQAKAAVIDAALITAPERTRTFLSQAGPLVFLDFLQLSITSF